jgi:hypothetical protein
MREIKLEIEDIEYLIISKDDLNRIFVMKVYKPKRSKAKTRYGVVEVYENNKYIVHPFYLSENTNQLYIKIIHNIITSQIMKNYMSKYEYGKTLEKNLKELREIAESLE